ncbi:unnamed protein product [Brachionus calyciflorus]|uniref:Uncharacterized protein n=1 Tax=Brachionus calyciflorus TaxID=104777 RepID=A0A814A4Q8_9BILA|nr:unnamed protein product [Brachionus calyciflorus]
MPNSDSNNLDEDELLNDKDYQPNSVEFENLVNQSEFKRFFSGAETIIHFKQDPKSFEFNSTLADESYFYCKICLEAIEKTNLIRHCSSYIHLFRYFKFICPVEYERVIDPKKLHISAEFVIKLLESRSNHEKDFKKLPELVYLDNLRFKFREFCKKYPFKNRQVYLDNINFSDLKYLNERDEERAIDQVRYNTLKSMNRPVQSTFLQHLIESNEDDFISVPGTSSNEPGRFVEHQSNIRQRDRGSMKRIDKSLVIKQEKLTERRVEEELPTVESNQCQPMEEAENNQGEEVSVEFLQELSDKIARVAENNNLDFDDEFIDQCTKYIDVLFGMDYINVEQMEIINHLFTKYIEIKDQGNTMEQSSDSQHIPTSFIKQEKIDFD